MTSTLQGDQKVSVHLTLSVFNPHTTDQLKMAITEHIRNVDHAILNTGCVNKCLVTGRVHFEHYL
jgi:hypothetical protein